MLRGEMPLIEGCRKICRLRHKLSDPENGVFLPIRGIESETDHFPLGEARSKCATENLHRTDTEMEQYLAGAREDILKACRQIIQVFSRPTS
jgi:hypothetical protein